MTTDEIKKLKVARIKCQQKLMFHTRYFFKKRYNRKFVINEHHQIITDTLERVVSGELTRVIFNVAPRYSKTELAVKNLISHCLSLNASAKFIHLSYSDDLALDNSEEIKDIVTSEEYQQLFPEVQLKKDSKSKKKWYTTKGGGVYATSASGQVTGFGAGSVDEENEEDILNEFLSSIEEKEQFGGAIVIDDPIKPEDADSKTIRERVNNRYDSTISNRVNSRKTPIIVIMQRLHPNDLSGYLIKQSDEWHVVSLPCIKDDGSALWPFKHTIDELLIMKGKNSIVFDRQYMQNPKPTEGLVYPDKFKTYKLLPVEPINENETKVQGWCAMFIDTADKGDDHFAAPIVQVIGNQIYLKDVIFDRNELITQESMVKSKVTVNGVSLIVIETNHAGNYFMGRIRQMLPDKEVYGQWSSKNKMSRILSVSGLVNRHLYVPEEQNNEMRLFLDECYNLTKTSKDDDDAPDALSGMFAHLEKHYQAFQD